MTRSKPGTRQSKGWMPFQQATEGVFPGSEIEGPFVLRRETMLWRFDDKPAVLDLGARVSP